MCDHTPTGTLRAFCELWKNDEGNWEALGFLVRNTGHPEAVARCPDAFSAMELVAQEMLEAAVETDDILLEDEG